jgi:ATP adenylyltransferase
VIENHLLVVTREYVDQEVLLDVADFEALLASLPEDVPAIGFYNGGRGSGASQPHKHLQVVTLPLSPRAAIPMAPLLDGASPRLPFRHAFARIERRDAGRASRLLSRADEEAGLGALTGHSPERQSHPYNLVVASDWMLLVASLARSLRGHPLNSLAYAGALFVREPRQLDAVRAPGRWRSSRRRGSQAERGRYPSMLVSPHTESACPEIDFPAGSRRIPPGPRAPAASRIA